MLKQIAKIMIKKMGYTITGSDIAAKRYAVVYCKCQKYKLQLLKFHNNQEFIEIYERCKQYTMTYPEKMYALYRAIKYISKHQIPGDLVECGVWRGGSAMIMALVLKKLNTTERKIYLYDTYSQGTVAPTEKDINIYGQPAKKEWDAAQEGTILGWGQVSLEEVQNNMFSTGYPPEKFIFVKGKVEDIIPTAMPDKISILRLNTDFYESTYHELLHLFPRLSVNGVIIIDDYGYWKGAKEAVDKYFKENNTKIFLHDIDGEGVIGIKT